MAKNCEFKTREAATKSWFRKQGLIDIYLNIPEGKLNAFRIANDKYAAKAHEQYGVEGPLFYEENGGKKAVPNTELFHIVDAMDGIFYPENSYLENKIVDNKQNNTIKKGVLELFESNPELANTVYEALGFGKESNLPKSNKTINIYAGSNQNAELSNFAIRPFTINVETPSGEKQYTFQSVEQGFHFYKALVANNPQIAKQILATTNGGQLKRLTNRSNLKMTLEQIKEWDNTSKSIMLNLMYDSYAQNPQAAEKLLATGDAKITHTQDNTRWKTDFPEVVMTVRDMLKEEGFSIQPQITPQQKQQAIQLYSQYLESLNKPNTNPILQGNQKADVILPIGTSGSGKSTFIKSLSQENLIVIEPDAMRVEFTGDINDKSKDKEIYIEAANRAIQAIKQGKQVVFDTTNLTKDKRLPFIEAIKKAIPTANIQYKLMELNPELAKQRIKADLQFKTDKKGLIKLVHYSSKNTNPLDNFQEDYPLYTSKGESSEYADYGKKFNFLIKESANIKSILDFHGKYGIDLDKHDQSSKGLQPYHFNLQEIQAIRNEGVDILIDDWGEYIILNSRAVILDGTQRANVPDATIDRHAESYKQMLIDIQYEPISSYELTTQQKQEAQQLYSQYLDTINNPTIQGFKEFVQGKQFQKLTAEEKAKTIEQVTKEHRSITALKDLSTKLAHRIGGTVAFQNHPNADWKGYNQGMKSVLNKAYMDESTAFHEIMGHPIIRALKAISSQKESVTLQQMIDNQEIEKKCN